MFYFPVFMHMLEYHLVSDGNAKILNKKAYLHLLLVIFYFCEKGQMHKLMNTLAKIICDVMNTKLSWRLFMSMVSQVLLYCLATWSVVTLDLFQQVKETKIFLGFIN